MCGRGNSSGRPRAYTNVIEPQIATDARCELDGASISHYIRLKKSLNPLMQSVISTPKVIITASGTYVKSPWGPDITNTMMCVVASRTSYVQNALIMSGGQAVGRFC